MSNSKWGEGSKIKETFMAGSKKVSNSQKQIFLSQGINFTVQQIKILAWCVKRQNIAEPCQQIFIAVQLIFFPDHVLLLAELAAKFKFFKIAVWKSDSMKWGDLSLKRYLFSFWESQSQQKLLLKFLELYNQVVLKGMEGFKMLLKSYDDVIYGRYL